ncbi:hypothetical protein GN157_12130 [Flavobacterium rakeshii]|uniref:Uncharacterized protein n=1 Tax=Flavobacterium rakeshii TaxID=1038845 RepID=A0A6N8HFI0_9FLAO|nr:DUF6252 family protein [Flavobacterium rakeshii]MUV04458.1 hypothetical protein [Flavobacterium rakeshii]
MKRFKIVQAFALLFLAIGFTACDTEPVDPVLLDNIGENPGGSTGGSFTVDFNGQTYVATQSAAIYNEGMLSVNGVRISGSNIESVSFVLMNPVEGQTYTGNDILIIYTPAMSMYQYTNVNLDEEQPSGSVTITDIDLLNQTISGTFSFTGWWSNDEEDVEPIEFTNGAFTNVSYTGGMPPVNGNEDEFTASLDGNDYAIANIGVAVADAGSGETISINGFDTSNNKVVLTIDASLTPGTYQITGNMLEDVVGARYLTTSPESMYMATTGSVVINSKTEDRIAGTYSFSATNGTEVVNFTGTYDVDYSF